MLHRIALFFLVLPLICSCGRRGIPPSPDRWAPKLGWAKAADRNHVDLGFTEKMDIVTIRQLNNYMIVDGDDDTLGVLSVSLLPNGQIARLTTENQEPVSYTAYVSGVTDQAGNEVRPESRKSFQGSTARDTVRPRVKEIYPRDMSAGVAVDTALCVFFNETMDTSSSSLHAGSIVLLPPPADTSWKWNEQMTSVSVAILSLPSYQSCIYVTKGCKDYSGNRLLRLERSVFSTLDSIPRGRISGTVTAANASNTYMAVMGVFDSLWTPLFLDFLRDEAGRFSFQYLSDGTYNVAAAKDEDSDGTFDLRGISVSVSVQGSEEHEGVDVRLSRQVSLQENAEEVLLNFYRMNMKDGITD